MRRWTLFVLCAVLSQALCAQAGRGASETEIPTLRILLAQGGLEFRPGLERKVREIAAAADLRLGNTVIVPFAPGGSAKLPSSESWDLAVLVPGPLLDQASADRQLRPIRLRGAVDAPAQRKPWLLADVEAYGLVELRDPLRPLRWSELGESPDLSLPDLAREPGFLDALAGLMRRRGARGLESLWWGARMRSTSEELRAVPTAEDDRRRVAILRLTDEEIPSHEELLTVRLGVGVSSSAADGVDNIARALCAPTQLRDWVGKSPRLRRFASHLAFPPTADEVRKARRFAYRGAAIESDDLPDWITTALIAVFALLFGVLVLRSSRRRDRKSLSGTR